MQAISLAAPPQPGHVCTSSLNTRLSRCAQPRAVRCSAGVRSAACPGYNRLRKVEPMQRALRELDVRTWIAGLRRDRARTRADVDFVELGDGRWKLHPIADWTDRDVWQHLQRHDLPIHPLWKRGYVSIDDVHTTRPLEDGMDPEDTRFFGIKRECGLHFDGEADMAA